MVIIISILALISALRLRKRGATAGSGQAGDKGAVA